MRNTFEMGGGHGRGDFAPLAIRLGRTVDAIRKRAQRLGVKVYRRYHQHGLYKRPCGQAAPKPDGHALCCRPNGHDGDHEAFLAARVDRPARRVTWGRVAGPDEAKRIMRQIRSVTA